MHPQSTSPSDLIQCACGCGTEIDSIRSDGKPRRYVNGHNVRGLLRSAETRAKMSAAWARNPGRRSGNWRGGRFIDKKGYVLRWSPQHCRQRSGYVFEHILVYESAHGPVPRGYVVHHHNGEKQDNRVENLEMMTNAEHTLLHHLKRATSPH